MTEQDPTGMRPVSYNQAVGMLPEGDQQHTFVNPAPGMLIGADTNRAHVLALLQTRETCLSGPIMTGMRHGLCVLDDKGEPTFIETVQDEEREEDS
jgi:hypothetical protein